MNRQNLIISSIFLILAICILGFVTSPYLNFRIVKQVIAEGALLLFIFIFLIDNIWIKLFMIWCLIRVSLGTYGYTMDLEQTTIFSRLSYQSLNTMLYYVLYYQILKNIITYKMIPKVLDLICIVSLINLIMVFFQYYGIWLFCYPAANNISHISLYKNILFYVPEHHTNITGFLSNPNMTGSLLALSLPAFFRKGYINIVAILLILIGLYITNAMGAIIPSAIVLSIWIFIKLDDDSKAISLCIALIVFTLFIARYFKVPYRELDLQKLTNSRWNVWMNALTNLIPKRFYIGWGLGQWKNFYPTFESIQGILSDRKWYQAHNEFIQTFFEIGAIGVTFASGYFISLLKVFRKSMTEYKTICLLGTIVVLFNCQVNFLFHTTVVIIALTYLALLEVEYANHN